MASLSKGKGRVILSSIEIDKTLDNRMRAAIKCDPSLKHVKRSRAPWLRQAIEEMCDRSEQAVRDSIKRGEF